MVWEHSILTCALPLFAQQKTLQKWGADGWELVAVMVVPAVEGAHDERRQFYFKRPKKPNKARTRP